MATKWMTYMRLTLHTKGLTTYFQALNRQELRISRAQGKLVFPSVDRTALGFEDDDHVVEVLHPVAVRPPEPGLLDADFQSGAIVDDPRSGLVRCAFVGGA